MASSALSEQMVDAAEHGRLAEMQDLHHRRGVPVDVKDIAGWKVASDNEFLLQFYSPEAAAVLTLKLRSVAATCRNW